MVLTEEAKIMIPTNKTETWHVSTACMNMHKGIPGESDGFSILHTPGINGIDEILTVFPDTSVELFDMIMSDFSDLYPDMSVDDFAGIVEELDEMALVFKDMFPDSYLNEFKEVMEEVMWYKYSDIPLERIAGIILNFADMYPDMAVNDFYYGKVLNFHVIFYDMYLVRLIRVLNENECEYPVIQAAVWMITDAATDSELKNTLRTSNYGIAGASVINDEHIAEAERMLALAGISR